MSIVQYEVIKLSDEILGSSNTSNEKSEAINILKSLDGSLGEHFKRVKEIED
jgi:hypothetical protein